MTPTNRPRHRARLSCASLFAGSLVLAGCSTLTRAPPAPATLHAKILQTGVIRCFDQQPSPRKPTTCELSATAKEGNTIVFANDKPLTPSPIFSVPFDEKHLSSQAKPDYYTAKPIEDAAKYESMTKTPDGHWIIASTAFDRYTKETAELDPYNTLLAWPSLHHDKAIVLAATTRENVTSSSSLRDTFIQALSAAGKPVEYFKIEGLAAMPDHKLLFGVREIGKSYKDFNYSVTILETRYTEQDGNLALDRNFKIAYEFPELALRQIHETVGLSSIEYDAKHDRLLILTSFEKGEKPEDIGAYLWALPVKEMHAGGKPPALAMTGNQPLKFTHKAEGLTVLDDQRILVIHDDDRIKPLVKLDQESKQRPRELNESVFQILEVE
jgi:hypothetical protein